MSSSPGTKNLGGRPATGVGTSINLRLQTKLLAALDAFAADQPDSTPTRPEAVRRALADHLRAQGYLPDDDAKSEPGASQSFPAVDRYADADPTEAVMVTGVGPMILGRAVRKRNDWREHHGLELVSVFRGADKVPNVFGMADLGRLAELERFR